VLEGDTVLEQPMSPDRTALIVEDDTEARETLVDVLENEGYRASACRHGREALERLRHGSHPDVILLDLMMPVMSGWEFRVEQRKDPTLAGIPIVALSADGSPRAAAVDADAYLKKPINLDDLVTTLDRVIQQRQNRALQSRLAEVDRLMALGTLCAGLAHEVNNPLAYVTLNVAFVAQRLPELLDRGRNNDASPPVDPDVAKKLIGSLDHAQQGCERIRWIVQSLKAFSRPEDESRAPADVRKVVESILPLLAHEIDQRARLIKMYEPVPAVLVNEARLGQVFMNLLLNAAQSLPEGKDNEIEISVVWRPPRVVIEIRDTGAGIPPDIRGRIFEPFFTTKPVGLGTGLGLSICHGSVRAMGGELTFESEVGRGTVFRVALPSVDEPSASHD
jgi:signal transduction histidine kinase